MKKLTNKIFLRETSDYKEYLEIFSDGSIEIAIYYPINNYLIKDKN